MKLIIRKAILVAPGEDLHLQTRDLVIENGFLTAITENATATDHQVITLPDLHVSAGWFDSSVSFGEPGFEERGGLLNGLHTAASGGFTAVALQPDTYPVIDNKATVTLIKSIAKHAVNVYPIGALTQKMEGEHLAELFDMHLAGAVAFGDYKKNINEANLLKIALQYTQDFNGLVVTHAEDRSLAGQGVVHEGPVAASLGLKGIPPLAEDIMVARNLKLLAYTGGKLHIPCISTTEALHSISAAKASGLAVTCSVAVHQLVLTDQVLTSFDSRYKLNPPLRDEQTRQALLEGVLDGTIDIITSDHRAINVENKMLEFDLAMYGTVGLESAFGALLQVLPLDVVISKLTAAGEIFNQEKTSICVNKKANLTLFNPHLSGTLSQEHLVSKAKNAALAGYPMKGKVYGIIANDQIIIKPQ